MAREGAMGCFGWGGAVLRYNERAKKKKKNNNQGVWIQ